MQKHIQYLPKSYLQINTRLLKMVCTQRCVCLWVQWIGEVKYFCKVVITYQVKTVKLRTAHSVSCHNCKR